MGNSHPVEAWVIHRRPFRDTSLLLELLTRDHGRIGAVARGARGQRSRWRGVLEPFQPVLVDWRGRGELATLVFAEPGGRPLRFAGTRLAGAFYVSELTLRLLQREDPAPEVFDAYAGAVAALADPTGSEDVPLRLFEKRLLDALGYGLLLDATADTGEAVVPEACYRYELEHGPILSSADGSGLVVSGATLLALAREEFEAREQRSEAQRLMRAALRLYIGDRPLQSRSLYLSLRRGTRESGS